MTSTSPSTRARTELDLLVLGSGVAGLSAAVRAADTHGMAVGVLTKGELEQATTRWAQGGVAAVLSGDPDAIDLHLADTLEAGAGLCDIDAVRVLVDEGPSRVNELIGLGAIFDRDATGALSVSLEGGHSEARVIHAGGAATGEEVERALVSAVQRTVTVVHERSFGVDLLVDGSGCGGVIARAETGEWTEIPARNVLLATGGAGQLFSVTTNPAEATGDGTAMAIRAGAAVADLEFFQFHPTALHDPRMPRPLLSEALRGHGALIRDSNGERFVDELEPRDVVSRAMTARMLEQKVDHLWLDATGIAQFARRFPTITATLVEVGLDPEVDWLPIAPAAHHQCGGVITDLRGATSLPGLWAAGETTCTGVHGANRLASNSLLEGMVFGPRVVEAIDAGVVGPEASGAMRCVLDPDDPELEISGVHIGLESIGDVEPAEVPVGTAERRSQLQRAMTLGAGVLRTGPSLTATAAVVAGVRQALAEPRTVADHELTNLVTVAESLLAAATARTESRGAHTRSDHPELSEVLQVRLVVRVP